MTLGVTVVTPTQIIGDELKMLQLEITFDNSYSAGGEVIDTTGYGITTITSATFLGDAMADYWITPGLIGTRANGGITAHASDTKVAVSWQTDTATAPGVDVTNATDLSAHVYTMTIMGK